MPLLALHLLKSPTKAIKCAATANHPLCGKGEGMEHKGEQRKVSVEPWCKHWSCCGWQESTSRDEAMSNSAKIKPVALAVIKLSLSENIKKWVRESVESVIENLN